FQSWSYFKHQINIVIQNIVKTVDYLESFSVLSIFIIVLSLIFTTRSAFKDSRDNLIYLLVTLTIYCGGYTLLLVEMRYIYLVCILLIVMAFYMINKAYDLKLLKVKVKNVLVVLVILSFIIVPVIDLVQFANVGKGTYNLSQSLATDYGVHGNIASNGEWEVTLIITYYFKGKYYGITKNTTNSKDIERELKNNNIDYYFIWDDYDNIVPSGYREITNGKIEGLQIYKCA
ncbi:MAG: hypothetical protein ABFC34_05410, partial [Methanobacterium sp.]